MAETGIHAKNELFIAKITLDVYGSRATFMLVNSGDNLRVNVLKHDKVVYSKDVSDLERAKREYRRLISRFLDGTLMKGYQEVR